jgi:hypothetical protein
MEKEKKLWIKSNSWLRTVDVNKIKWSKRIDKNLFIAMLLILFDREHTLTPLLWDTVKRPKVERPKVKRPKVKNPES